MNNQHPITPPPELVDKRINQSPLINFEGYLADQAAQWGADQVRIQVKFPGVRTYIWQPQIDITTYELALCMPLMAVGTTPDGWTQMDWMYDHLPAKAQRHWSVEGKVEERL